MRLRSHVKWRNPVRKGARSGLPARSSTLTPRGEAISMFFGFDRLSSPRRCERLENELHSLRIRSLTRSKPPQTISASFLGPCPRDRICDNFAQSHWDAGFSQLCANGVIEWEARDLLRNRLSRKQTLPAFLRSCQNKTRKISVPIIRYRKGFDAAARSLNDCRRKPFEQGRDQN